MNNEEEVGFAAIKLGSVWAAVGITSWSDAASAIAVLYTACLLVKLAWDTFIRACFVRRGWVKPK